MIKSYADALYELAVEADAEEQIYSELKDISNLYKDNSDFVRILDMPSVDKKERTELTDRIFSGQVHEYVLNFLKILSERRLSGKLSGCFYEFEKKYLLDKNMIAVTAVTSVELTNALREQLSAKLANITGRQVILENKINPEMMGGILIKYENSQIDASVKTRLEDMRRKLIAKNI